jgi:hypothetical protein
MLLISQLCPVLANTQTKTLLNLPTNPELFGVATKKNGKAPVIPGTTGSKECPVTTKGKNGQQR